MTLTWRKDGQTHLVAMDAGGAFGSTQVLVCDGAGVLASAVRTECDDGLNKAGVPALLTEVKVRHHLCNVLACNPVCNAPTPISIVIRIVCVVVLMLIKWRCYVRGIRMRWEDGWYVRVGGVQEVGMTAWENRNNKAKWRRERRKITMRRKRWEWGRVCGALVGGEETDQWCGMRRAGKQWYYSVV